MDVVCKEEKRNTVNWELGVLWQALNLTGWLVVAHGNQRMESNISRPWYRQCGDDII